MGKECLKPKITTIIPNIMWIFDMEEGYIYYLNINLITKSS